MAASGAKQTCSIFVAAAKCRQETHAPQQTVSLFDHLVGARKQSLAVPFGAPPSERFDRQCKHVADAAFGQDDAWRVWIGFQQSRLVCFQRQTYVPLTSTRTHAAPPTTAPPTTAPPTTARRVVRRATPATLTGVNGRPTRACALSTDNESPPDCDRSIEPETPNTTTAATSSARFNLT